MNHQKAFTLIELLITIAIIGLLAISFPLTINFRKQITKSYDGKRKADLDNLKKTLEEFYTDKGRYPTNDEICSSLITTAAGCTICKTAVNPVLQSYTATLPCDPESPTRQYIYQLLTNGYRIYATLNNTDDQAIISVGCDPSSGCPNNSNANYGVSSPNVGL